MRRRAVIAGCLVGLGLAPGCVGARLRREEADRSPAAASLRDELSREATAAMDRGDYARARDDLGRLLAESPRSAELHFRLGKVLQLQGDLPGAEVAYRQALALEPEYVGAVVGLGQIDARANRPEEALGRFERAIEVDPHRAEAHLARGRTLESLGKPDAALAAYFRAIELDPALSPAIVRIASLQRQRGQSEQALVRVDQATELTPEDPEVRLERGLTLLALDRPGPAIADLAFAAERIPDRAEALIGLARAFEADRQPELARQAADRALRLQPESPVAREINDRLRR